MSDLATVLDVRLNVDWQITSISHASLLQDKNLFDASLHCLPTVDDAVSSRLFRLVLKSFGRMGRTEELEHWWRLFTERFPKLQVVQWSWLADAVVEAGNHDFFLTQINSLVSRNDLEMKSQLLKLLQNRVSGLANRKRKERDAWSSAPCKNEVTENMLEFIANAKELMRTAKSGQIYDVKRFPPRDISASSSTVFNRLWSQNLYTKMANDWNLRHDHHATAPTTIKNTKRPTVGLINDKTDHGVNDIPDWRLRLHFNTRTGFSASESRYMIWRHVNELLLYGDFFDKYMSTQPGFQGMGLRKLGLVDIVFHHYQGNKVDAHRAGSVVPAKPKDDFQEAQARCNKKFYEKVSRVTDGELIRSVISARRAGDFEVAEALKQGRQK